MICLHLEDKSLERHLNLVRHSAHCIVMAQWAGAQCRQISKLFKYDQYLLKFSVQGSIFVRGASRILECDGDSLDQMDGSNDIANGEAESRNVHFRR